MRKPGALAVIAVSAMAATSWLLTQPPPNTSPTHISNDDFQSAFAEEWMKISLADQQNICFMYYGDRATTISLMDRDFTANTGVVSKPEWWRQAMDYACDYSL